MKDRSKKLTQKYNATNSTFRTVKLFVATARPREPEAFERAQLTRLYVR